MENDKSPGIDGIPIEFYKESYVLFVKNLLQPYNNIFFIEKKSTKIKNQAIITFIPKKSNLNILRYWRPMSFVSVNYKILTNIFSTRLKKIPSHFIAEGKKTSIPQRTILNNLRLTSNIITYL